MEENQAVFSPGQQYSDIPTYEDAVRPGEKRIIFTGPRR
jgi:hypothetical protein